MVIMVVKPLNAIKAWFGRKFGTVNRCRIYLRSGSQIELDTTAFTWEYDRSTGKVSKWTATCVGNAYLNYLDPSEIEAIVTLR